MDRKAEIVEHIFEVVQELRDNKGKAKETGRLYELQSLVAELIIITHKSLTVLDGEADKARVTNS